MNIDELDYRNVAIDGFLVCTFQGFTWNISILIDPYTVIQVY